MNVEVTPHPPKATPSTKEKEPIEDVRISVKVQDARTRDEEILARLTVYVSSLIRGARLVIHLNLDNCSALSLSFLLIVLRHFDSYQENSYYCYYH